MGDRNQAKDLSKRDQGYPYVPIEQSDPRWDPAPRGTADRGDGRSGRRLGPAIVGLVGLVVLLVVVVLLIAVF